MDPAEFCAQTRLFIVVGKGGVGKTTLSAALARMAADAGLRVLVVEVEGKSGVGAAFGRPGALDYREVDLAPRVRARTLTPDDALVEYLEDHGLRRTSRRLVSSGVVDVVATAVPGIKDILVLGKVKQLERAGVADLVVLDAPAAGHAVSFLTSASSLLDAARVGPIRAQAADVVGLLTDPTRCRVLLATLAEETPVNETVETAARLDEQVGVVQTAVVVNAVHPPVAGLDADPAAAAAAVGVRLSAAQAEALRAAAAFRRERAALQAEQVARLSAALPLPQLRLPFLPTTEVGPAEVGHLAAALATEVAAMPAIASPPPTRPWTRT